MAMQLRDYRTTAGLTLQQVADTTGISTAAISRHERGIYRPTLEEIDVYQSISKGAVRFDDWLELARTTTQEKEPANG